MQSLGRHQDGSLERALAGVKADFDAWSAREPRRDDATIVALSPRLT